MKGEFDGVNHTMSARSMLVLKPKPEPDFGKVDTQDPEYLKWAWRNRPRRPQAKATRGKPDARSGGMDRLSNEQVVREPGFSRRRVRIMARDWRRDVRAAAKRRLNKVRSGGAQ